MDSHCQSLSRENVRLSREVARLRRRESVAEKLKKARLPNILVTEFFVEQLHNARDEHSVDELIKDRQVLLKPSPRCRAAKRDTKRKMEPWWLERLFRSAKPTELTREELEEAAARLDISIEHLSDEELMHLQVQVTVAQLDES